jgi:hypothetical protein
LSAGTTAKLFSGVRWWSGNRVHISAEVPGVFRLENPPRPAADVWRGNLVALEVGLRCCQPAPALPLDVKYFLWLHLTAATLAESKGVSFANFAA